MSGTKKKPSPRLMCSTAPFFRSPLRQAFRAIEGAGFQAVEVMVTADPHTQEPHLLAPLAREFGLRIDAIHAPFLLLTRRVWGTDPIGKIYRAAHLAEEIGAPIVVVHPPFRWQVRFRRWIQSSLEDFSSRTGVTVAVENMFPLRFRGERGLTFHSGQEFEDLERFPFLVLDTSHAAVAGLDIRTFYTQYRDRIQHVHLSNNAGKGWDSHLPVYQDGVLPLGEFLDDVVQDGFAGAISLELDLRPWLRDEVSLREVLVRNREFCEARLDLRSKRPAREPRPGTPAVPRGRVGSSPRKRRPPEG
jgi:sugar phosphate isomerase/epimerase